MQSGTTHWFKHPHRFCCASNAFPVLFWTEVSCQSRQFSTALEMQSTGVPFLILQSLVLFFKSMNLKCTWRCWNRYHLKLSCHWLKKQAKGSPWIREGGQGRAQPTGPGFLLSQTHCARTWRAWRQLRLWPWWQWQEGSQMPRQIGVGPQWNPTCKPKTV